MTQSICVLGRQPAVGLAELESLFGAEKVEPAGLQAALLDINPALVPFKRLGGTVKLARLITILNTADWKKIEQYLSETAAHYSSYLPEGKMTVGISVYGLPVKPAQINATALSLKKLIKSTGRSVRVVPNKTAELSSAQVLHNNLTGDRAWELLFIRDHNRTILAQTVAIQDIEAYAARDQARPKRDARVGMLPPKLAQIIVNMAVTNVDPKHGGVLLDPFCGTGVLLQEALLMGFDIYGTDIDERMVDFSSQNLAWLTKQPYSPVQPQGPNDLCWRLEAGDATEKEWIPIPNFIACETYLGRPFSATPKPEVLRAVIQDVDTIHKKFLQNVARQVDTGFRMCLAVPAWKTTSGFRHLKVLDSLEEIGYTRMSFVHVRNDKLIYHREGQIVGRELIVLMRK